MGIIVEQLDETRTRVPIDTHYSRIVDAQGRPLYTEYGAQSNYLDDSGDLRRAQRDVTIEDGEAIARSARYVTRFSGGEWPVEWKRRTDGKVFRARPAMATAFDERTLQAVVAGKLADPGPWTLNTDTRELENAFGIDEIRVKFRLAHGGPGTRHRLYRSLLDLAPGAKYYGTVWEVNDEEAAEMLTAGDGGGVRFWTNGRWVVEYVRRDAWGESTWIQHDYTTVGGSLTANTVWTAGTYEITSAVNMGVYDLSLDCSAGPIYLKVNFVGITINCDGTGDFSIVNSAFNRRAYCTSANDDSIGEVISGSSGTPATGDYRSAFKSSGSASIVSVRYFDIRYSGGGAVPAFALNASGETATIDHLWLSNCDATGRPLCGADSSSVAALSQTWSNVHIDDTNYTASGAVSAMSLTGQSVIVRNVFVDQQSSNGGVIEVIQPSGTVTGSTIDISNVISHGSGRRIEIRGDDGIHTVSVRRCTLIRTKFSGGVIYVNSAGTGTVNMVVDDCVAIDDVFLATSRAFENAGGTGTVNLTLNNCVDWNIDVRLTGTITDNNPITADPMLTTLPPGVTIDPEFLMSDGYAIGNLLTLRYAGSTTYNDIPLDPKLWSATGYRDLPPDEITPGAQYLTTGTALPTGGPEDEGDVLLEQTPDDGEITITNGLVTMTPGLDNAAYLSLFGGNDDDPGGEDTTLAWWGNLTQERAERQYRSETQYLLRAIPAITANLRRIEDAVRRDLAWMLSNGVAASVEAEATIPALNKVQIDVTINGDETLTYTENWQRSL